MAAWLRYSKKRLLGALIVLSLAAAVFGQGATSYLRHAAHVLIAPAGDGGMYLVTSLRSGREGGPGLSSEEVRRVLEERDRLRLRMVQLERDLLLERADRRRERQAMQHIRREAFDPSDDLPCELIPARVAAADSLPYGHGRVLNVGTGRGASAGAPVLSRVLMTDRLKELPPRLAVMTDSALVGRIESAGPFTARLQLLTDPAFAIRARIVRRIDPNHARWIKVLTQGAAADERLRDENNAPVPVLASGDGAGGMLAEDVSTYESIQPGDWLWTSDDDPYLRREVRIGVVYEVRPKPSDHQFVQVRIRPFEDLRALRDVYIVYWKPL